MMFFLDPTPHWGETLRGGHVTVHLQQVACRIGLSVLLGASQIEPLHGARLVLIRYLMRCR